ncbi:hypothetical protein ACMFMG_006152 [Clarireedia jacksonii]
MVPGLHFGIYIVAANSSLHLMVLPKSTRHIINSSGQQRSRSKEIVLPDLVPNILISTDLALNATSSLPSPITTNNLPRQLKMSSSSQPTTGSSIPTTPELVICRPHMTAAQLQEVAKLALERIPPKAQQNSLNDRDVRSILFLRIGKTFKFRVIFRQERGILFERIGNTTRIKVTVRDAILARKGLPNPFKMAPRGNINDRHRVSPYARTYNQRLCRGCKMCRPDMPVEHHYSLRSRAACTGAPRQ